MTPRNVQTLKQEKTTQITSNPIHLISKPLFLCRVARMLEPKAGIAWITLTDIHTFTQHSHSYSIYGLKFTCPACL